MRNLLVTITVFIIVAQLTAFDFDAFAKVEMKLGEAEKLIQKYEPSSDLDHFKKEMVLNCSRFDQSESALSHLQNALDIAAKLDSTSKQKAATYMKLLLSPNCMQYRLFNPSKFSYEDLIPVNEYILNFLRLRSDLVIELNEIALMEMEMEYLRRTRNSVYKARPEQEVVDSLIKKIGDYRISITNIIYRDVRISN